MWLEYNERGNRERGYCERLMDELERLSVGRRWRGRGEIGTSYVFRKIV